MSGSAAASAMTTDGALASSIAVMSSSGRKRPMRSTPSVTGDAFTRYRDVNGEDELGMGGPGDDSPCKKPRYPSSPDDCDYSVTTVEALPAADSPSVNTGAGDSRCDIPDNAGQLGASVSFVQASSDSVHMDGNDAAIPAAASAGSGAPSVDTSAVNHAAEVAGNHAAEVAASRLESQIDDLTSDLGGWCLTDLKSWRRRRAAVAAAAASASVVVAESKSKKEGNDSCNVTENDMNLMESQMASKGPHVSPRKKDAPGGSPSRSPSVVPNSPPEKEFLRQRRREARKSMLRGIASSGRRKLEV